jgi:hypothetical protein
VLKVQEVRTASSQTCLAELISDAVPLSIFSGARPGAVGFTQSVGPAGVAGAIMS